MMWKIILCIFLLNFYVYAQTGTDASATGISRAFNPALSVNGLFDAVFSDESVPLWEETGNTPGLHYQEICIEMTSNVDIYLQAQIALSAEAGHGFEVEEAYVTTLRLPLSLIIRGGKMLNTFGRHNLYHLHHMAFAEPPMIHNQVFGSNLNELSVEAAYLLPLDWYSDITVGVLNGDNTYLFNSEKNNDLAYLVHLDDLWDFTDEITLRLGGSFLTGKRGRYYFNNGRVPVGADTSNIRSVVWGFDFFLKWRPLERGRYRSFTLMGEYIDTRIKFENSLSDPLHGFFLQALAQVDLRWWVQARYGYFNRSKDLHQFFPEPENFPYTYQSDLDGSRYSVSVAYVPTEFSAYRLQYNYIKIGNRTEQQIIAQLNITIGSHPAHKY